MAGTQEPGPRERAMRKAAQARRVAAANTVTARADRLLAHPHSRDLLAHGHERPRTERGRREAELD